jgi:tetratricopeptide (TPR) repeat protein
MPYEDALQVAIQTALSGDRERARALLIAFIRQNSKNFLAWLWLSELAKNPKEQAFALEQAQALCPPDAVGRRDVQPYLARLRASLRPAAAAPAGSAPTNPVPTNPSSGASTPPASSAEASPAKTAGAAAPVHSAAVLAAKAAEVAAAKAGEQPPRSNIEPPAAKPVASDPYYRAERLARIGKQAEAVRLLNALVKKEPQDERAWLLLSELEANPQEKLRLLQRVLAISPHHSLARQRLVALQHMREDPLRRGQSLEEAGQDEQAIQLYNMVIAHSQTPAQRIEASRRIANIRLRQESDQAQPIHPTLNLLRVTVGPVLLFVMMVFIQSGLNLSNLPLLSLPGILLVLAGSFLVSATTMRPMHPKWIEIFGAPGAGSEPETRFRLQLLGWLCMLAPFSIFLVDAGFRLGALSASMFEVFP